MLSRSSGYVFKISTIHELLSFSTKLGAFNIMHCQQSFGSVNPSHGGPIIRNPLRPSQERLSSQTYERTMFIQSLATALLRLQQSALCNVKTLIDLEKGFRCRESDTLIAADRNVVANSE